MSQGDQFLSDKEQYIIQSGTDYLAELVRNGEATIARTRATGATALFADHLKLTESAGSELVEKLRQRLHGLPEEEAVEIMDAFEKLVLKIPEANNFPVLEQVGDAGTDGIVAIHPVELASLPLDVFEAETTQSSLLIPAQQVHVDSSEQITQDIALKTTPSRYFESIVGPIDDLVLTTKDAEALADFLMTLRSKPKRNVKNAFPYKKALIYKFQNFDGNEVSKLLELSYGNVSVSLTNFKKLIMQENKPDDIRRLFEQVFVQRSADEEHDDSVDNKSFKVISEPVADEVDPRKDERLVQMKVPMPSSLIKPRLPIVKKSVEQQSTETTYSDVLDIFVEIFKIDKDKPEFGIFSAFLSTNIKAAGDISSVNKNRLAYAIRGILRKKFVSRDGVIKALQLNESERVAFTNTLGWTTSRDGTDDSCQPVLIARYIHPEGKYVNEDHKYAVESLFVKIAKNLSI